MHIRDSRDQGEASSFASASAEEVEEAVDASISGEKGKAVADNNEG